MLLDHFHPPLSSQRFWQSFLHHWAVRVCGYINARLPRGWWAEPQIRFGMELDVGEVEGEDGDETIGQLRADAATAWRPRAPTGSVEIAVASEVVSVAVLNRSYDPALMAAIEFVCPRSKDCPDARDMFTSRGATVLGEGAGLIVVDIVTGRQTNLHAALIRRLRRHVEGECSDLYAVAYHATNCPEATQARVRLWEHPLAVGQPLPTLPLFLRVGPMIPIDLQTTYLHACRDLRIHVAEPTIPTTARRTDS